MTCSTVSADWMGTWLLPCFGPRAAYSSARKMPQTLAGFISM